MEEVLLYFSLLHQGQWDKIITSISRLEKIDKAKYLELKKDLKVGYATLVSEDYPHEFKVIDRPPFVIYYQGNLDLLKSDQKISIVGARACSNYGRSMAEKLALGLAEQDWVIVSGLALGIDSVAHRQKLSQTIAVLPCGIETCYPPSHQQLKEEIIAAGGLVISEFPGALTAERPFFPVRNRLVAALGRGLVVVEAGQRSGTSITVGYALDYGKDIFAVPTRADYKNGTNDLIKTGAYLVEKAEDIIDYYS